MSAEGAAESVMDAIADHIESVTLSPFGPEQDIRTGGYFFDFTLKGRTYEVLVQETH